MDGDLRSGATRTDPALRRIGRMSGFVGVTALAVALTGPALNAQNSAAAVFVLPAGSGREIVEKSCVQCHALGLAVSKRRTPEGWAAILQQMIGFGLALDAAQLETVHTYLAANFAEGPAAAGATPARPAAVPVGQSFPRPSGLDQWPAYGGGNANRNWSDLTQITPQNVAKLKPAWTYHYGAGQTNQGDMGLDYRFEATPLMIGGVLYVSTPASPLKPDLKASVTALDPVTGAVIWKYESPANIHGRGLAYWPGDVATPPRLIFGTDGGLIMAIDMTTGRPAKGFGRGGQIDAYVGVVSETVGESRRSSFTIPNPVTIYKNLIITGSRPGEMGPPAPRGDIRAWDARTGRLVWTFHTTPLPGEPNSDAFHGDDWRDISGANVWSTMALDEENGILFAPVGDDNSDVKGSQLYSSSMLALDAATGKLRWFHQITHHDIWDWDLSTPPVLFDAVKDGKPVPAVLVTGKHSLVFLFDRLTGAPLNGFEERPTPQPKAASDDVWPTQPFPTAPGPIARTQMTRDEVADVLPGMKAACQAQWDEAGAVSLPLYAPRQSPDFAAVTFPGPLGGPNWGGGSYNAELGLYFINVQNRAIFRPKSRPNAGFAMMQRAAPPEGAPPPPPRRGGPQPFTFAAPDGSFVPCSPTPWGELVAVDVRNLKIAWRVPLGSTLSLGAKGAATGSPNLGGNIATKSGLIFIGATNDRRFRAFDAKTGRKLWETPLDASAHSTPITYMGKDGRQYVVVAAAGGTAVGGREMSDALVAYALPGKR